ncbi:MAG: hypothetical protein WA081_04705 [Desulfosalsimonadaceae bacterium]
MSNLPATGHESKANILELFQNALKADGTINGRSSFGKAIAAIQGALNKNEVQAAGAMVRKDIALYSIIEKVIESHLVSNPEQIISADGKINPLISVELLRIQEAKRRALTFLIDLKKKEKNKGKSGKGRDLNNISFD